MCGPGGEEDVHQSIACLTGVLNAKFPLQESTHISQPAGTVCVCVCVCVCVHACVRACVCCRYRHACLLAPEANSGDLLHSSSLGSDEG